jgi:hypothetical protein
MHLHEVDAHEEWLAGVAVAVLRAKRRHLRLYNLRVSDWADGEFKMSAALNWEDRAIRQYEGSRQESVQSRYNIRTLADRRGHTLD